METSGGPWGPEGVFLARVEDIVDPATAAGACSLADPASLLSSRERDRWRRIRHRQRSAEFLAVRVLAKYLWCSPPATALEAAPASARHVAREALQGFLESAFEGSDILRRCRSLQVLPGENGAPELRWRSRTVPHHAVSLTHADGWAAVAVTGAARVGIDLEKIETRSRSFASLFSAAEHAWCEAQGNVPPEARLTLLWALREAAFKAGVVPEDGAERLEIVPRGPAPTPLSGIPRSSWPLQPLPVSLPGRRLGLARVLVSPSFVLAELAAGALGTRQGAGVTSHPGEEATLHAGGPSSIGEEPR